MDDVKSGENSGLDEYGSDESLNGNKSWKGSIASGVVEINRMGRKRYGRLLVAIPRVAKV